MRVADRTQSRNYLRGLNDNVYKIMQSQERFTTGLRYQNMSDNVSATSRSMRADQTLTKVNQQLSGIEYASDELNAADDALQAIVDVFKDAREGTLTKALNMLDKGDIKLSALIGELKNYKDEILQFTNSQFSDQYLFSGTNSAAAPFSVDANGKVLYNGIAVDEIKKDDTTGEFYYEDAGGNRKPIPQNEDVYLDVGKGIRVEGNKVDPGSAFKISFSGLDILGWGVTEGKDGFEMSNNIYNLMDQAQNIMQQIKDAGADEDISGLKDQLGQVFDHMTTRFDTLSNNQTEVGGRTQFLERVTGRLQDQADTLETLKKSLVGTKEEEETTILANANKTYQATLAIGANLFQTSLIDFLR